MIMKILSEYNKELVKQRVPSSKGIIIGFVVVGG
jgi:hypothetical protein